MGLYDESVPFQPFKMSESVPGVVLVPVWVVYFGQFVEFSLRVGCGPFQLEDIIRRGSEGGVSSARPVHVVPKFVCSVCVRPGERWVLLRALSRGRLTEATLPCVVSRWQLSFLQQSRRHACVWGGRWSGEQVEGKVIDVIEGGVEGLPCLHNSATSATEFIY